ncbi:hypothetical protein ABBQ32_007020 [Trebouxia sp. C0010 RCD-2024]
MGDQQWSMPFAAGAKFQAMHTRLELTELQHDVPKHGTRNPSQVQQCSVLVETERPRYESVQPADWGFASSFRSCQEAPLLMMTTSGLKSLGESAEEAHINQDLRQGCSSFASQQQFHSYVGSMAALSEMTTDAANCRNSMRRSVVRRNRH